MAKPVVSGLSLLVLALGSASWTFANEHWPQFRGTNAAGIIVTDGTLPSRLEPDANVLWKVAIPHGVSSPCIWDGRVFLTGHDADRSALVTLCLDSNSGELLWQRRKVLQKIPPLHVATSPAAPSIATDGERLYVYFGLTGLTCLDLDGQEIWQKELPIPHNRHGAGSSPVLAGDLLILVCDQGELFRPLGSYVLCLNKHTGSEIWRRARPLSGAGWTTPVIWSHEQGQELIVLGRRLIAYDLANGEPRWWVDGMLDFALSTPVIGGGLLFAVTAAGGLEAERRIVLPSFAEVARRHDANGDGRLVREELPSEMLFYKGDTTGLPGDGVSARDALGMFDGDQDGFVTAGEWDGAIELWNQRQNTLVASRPGGRGDVTRTHVVWRAKRQLPEVPSPLYYQGHLYLIKNGGLVSCLNAQSGQLVYRKRIGATGNYFASPIAGDNKLYIATDTGVVSVLQTGETPRLLSRSELGEPIVATPASVQGRLLVRTAEHLYCFDRQRSTNGRNGAQVESFRYLRPAGSDYRLESEVVIRKRDAGQVTSITCTTHRSETRLTVVSHYDPVGQLENAQVTLSNTEGQHRVEARQRNGFVEVDYAGGKPFKFDVPADAIVTSAPDWTDAFTLALRYDAEQGGAQEFVGLWIHPTRQPLRLTLRIRQLGSDSVVHQGAPQQLDRYLITLRGGSRYVAWRNKGHQLIRLAPEKSASPALVLQGWEVTTKDLRPGTL